MKKLKLDLDDLRVASFDTSPPAGEHAGTVAGHQATKLCVTDPAVCPFSLYRTCQFQCTLDC